MSDFSDLFVETFAITPTANLTYFHTPKVKEASTPVGFYSVLEESDLEIPESQKIDIPQKVDKSQEPQKKSTNDELIRIDIEDLLRSEGITSVNGKKIKFGNKNLRPSNAGYGVPNSNHKRRDPYTGNAMARDISIPGGTDYDYTAFRSMLLNNQRVREYLAAKNWGILNELTPSIMKRTHATGRHFHFGPDSSARRTWKQWLSTPHIPVTQIV